MVYINLIHFIHVLHFIISVSMDNSILNQNHTCIYLPQSSVLNDMVLHGLCWVFHQMGTEVKYLSPGKEIFFPLQSKAN